MTIWQACKYTSLIALQNDVVNSSLWRSIAVKIPWSGDFGNSQNKGKAHLPMPSYIRPHVSIGHKSYSSYGKFRNNGSKGASGSKVSWGHPKDTKGYF